MTASAGRLRIFNFTKRVIDVTLTVLAAPLLLVLGFGAALAVRLSMGSPVIFRQKRIGLNEQEFLIFKFRTMANARGVDGVMLPDSVRLTRVGKILRKTSLDELPQFLNILRGDMSLVGPRPLLPEYLPYYFADERPRHQARPGITGLAQVAGRNSLLWDQRLRLDSAYVSRSSLLGDLAIVWETVKQVFTARGISTIAGESGEPLDVVRSYPRSGGYALRRFEYMDISTRVAWFHHPEVRKFMSLPESVTIASTTEWLQAARSKPDRRDFSVYRIADGRVVALIGVGEPSNQGVPEMYMLVDPDQHGRGIGRISLQLLLEWMGLQGDYKGCSLSVSEDNVHAVALYLKLGFEVTRRHANESRVEMKLDIRQ